MVPVLEEGESDAQKIARLEREKAAVSEEKARERAALEELKKNVCLERCSILQHLDNYQLVLLALSPPHHEVPSDHDRLVGLRAEPAR